MATPKRNKPSSTSATSATRKTDDFESVAKRLECDEDKARFEKKLGKIAKANISGKPPAKSN